MSFILAKVELSMGADVEVTSLLRILSGVVVGSSDCRAEVHLFGRKRVDGPRRGEETARGQME